MSKSTCQEWIWGMETKNAEMESRKMHCVFTQRKVVSTSASVANVDASIQPTLRAGIPLAEILFSYAQTVANTKHELMLVSYWPSVCDAAPARNQHCFSISCELRCPCLTGGQPSVYLAVTVQPFTMSFQCQAFCWKSRALYCRAKKDKRTYMLTLQVSRYCILLLQRNIGLWASLDFFEYDEFLCMIFRTSRRPVSY